MNDIMPALEQSNQFSPMGGILYLVFYFVITYFVFRIANRLNTQPSWFAFVPILQQILMFWMAGMSGWWVLFPLLLLVPALLIFFSIFAVGGAALAVGGFILSLVIIVLMIANLIILIRAMVRILQKLGITPWAVILLLIPGINVVFLGYLAFMQPRPALV